MDRKKALVRFGLSCGLVFLLALTVLGGAAVIEQIGEGEVDWETGVIRVIGYGAPPEGIPGAIGRLLAQRAAKADAYRNALEVIEGVRVRSETLVENYMVVSDQIRLNVQGFIRGGRFEQATYDMENICEILLVLPLGGHKGLGSLLIDAVQKELPAVPPAPREEVLRSPDLAVYTGIVIDTRGFEVKPALYPQIFDSSGYLLYGPTMPDAARTGFSTMAAYSRSLEKALAMPRVAGNPLLLKATSVVQASGGETTDVVLDSEAAALFRGATAEGDLLAKAAVVFVID